jgi:GxxExxY protein
MAVELVLKEEVYAIIGAAMEVHRELRGRFLEAIYQEALDYEFASRNIPFESQVPLTVWYKNHPLTKKYVADAICYRQVILELKVMDQLTPREEAQLLNYMEVTRMKVGVLINFGDPGRLDWKRFVL